MKTRTLLDCEIKFYLPHLNVILKIKIFPALLYGHSAV
jgi:hypothetical protein